MQFEELSVDMQVRVIDWDYDIEGRPGHWSAEGDMDDYRGCVVTIGELDEDEGYIYLHGDDDDYGWQWFASDFDLYNPISASDPNMVYRKYKHEKRVAALRNQMRKSTYYGSTITGRYKSS